MPLLAAGCGGAPTTAGAPATLRDVARTTPVVMGYALEGSARPSSITRDGDFLDTIGVAGVA